MGQLLLLLSPGDGEGIVIQHHGTDDDFSFTDNLCPPQQGLDPQKHFIRVHGFGHIVIGAHQESLFPVFRQLLGGNHQDRQIAVSAAQGFCEFIAVHPRHHNVQNGQVNVLPVHDGQCFLTITGSGYGVAVALQNSTHQPPGIFVVIHHENMKHCIPLSGFACIPAKSMV